MFDKQNDRVRRNVNHLFDSDDLVDRASSARENGSKKSSNFLLNPSSSSSPSPSSSTPNGGVNYIEHHVSKMDTLAGVAIKYGVEIADVKRMNGLVTDLQMFALKSLQIPLPGRHPPSSSLSNGSANSGQHNSEETPPRRRHSDILESFHTRRLKSPQRRISLAMSNLQGYYGLKPSKPPNQKSPSEGTEMKVYKTDRAHYLEDDMLPKSSPFSDPPPSRHRKSRSLVDDLLSDIELISDAPISEAGIDETDKSNGKSVRRRQKPEPSPGSTTQEMLLKEENSSGGNGFSAIAGKGLALRPKSASRNNIAGDSDTSWLNPNSVGLGDSLVGNGLTIVRKSSSASNLPDQEQSSSSSSIWATSKWNLKQDLQAFSSAAITRPIFDGLPKAPITRRNKAALD